MNFIKSLFEVKIPHRVVAHEVKEFIFCLDVNEDESRIANLLNADVENYVFERNILRWGVASQIYRYFAEKHSGSSIEASYIYFLQISSDYYLELKKSSADSLSFPTSTPDSIYFIVGEPPAVSILSTFIERLSGNGNSQRDLINVPNLYELVDCYVKSTVSCVKGKVVMLG
jgi:hypothetical protein